jgi:hypothetical protein
VKSAFAMSTGKPTTNPNAKTKIAKVLVVFIFFSFQNSVNIFTPCSVHRLNRSSSFVEQRTL